MTKKDKFFFFGYGQTAKYFIDTLIKSKKNFYLMLLILKKLFQKHIKKKNLYHINLKMIFMIKNLKIN